MTKLTSICVYCGSADRLSQDYIAAAENMGRELARRGIHCVYGGGKTGMMGALAEGILKAGGEITGVVPRDLFPADLLHEHLTRIEWTADMHSRKARMRDLAQAFIALPGGFGTLDELFETLTWAQIGLHQKPSGLLNTRGYFDPLLEMVELARREGFIYSEHQSLLVDAKEPGDLLDRLEKFNLPSGLERWMYRVEDQNKQASIGSALKWLITLLDRHHVPYQVVGGLAAQAYGATRPLVDIDLYVPLEQAKLALEEMRPYLQREPLPHRSDSWDLIYLALQFEEVWIEIGDSSSNPCFFNRVDQRWEPQVIDYTRSEHVKLYGVEVNVMPKDDLVRYKAMLDREVDHLDILEMGNS